VWLLSGNLNRSNEPDASSPPTTEDRDWHLILEDPQVARVFEAYIKQDYASAAPFQLSATDARAVEEAAIAKDAEAKRAAEENPPKHGSRPNPNPLPRATQTFPDSLRVTPLLTPDRLPNGKGQYLSNMLALIASATKSLWIQLQYIEASKGDGSDYDGLLQAIEELGKRPGFDLRLLQNRQFGEKWAEKMKSAGVDLTPWIRMQPNVHNKGFIVDGRVAVVSSQNFSPEGIDQNRDAGLILDSQDVAAFFEPVFDSDWKIAVPFAPRSGSAPAKKKAKRKP
jgi:phosphatidylserine/phosphatidylglycerophosphate/cardiolipin synthase-like enzyme